MLLASFVALTLHADPTAWVAVSRRSGVSRASALELARAISAHLTDSDLKARFLPPEDLSSCNGKVSCLMARGHAAKADAMICIESGSALEDQVVVLTLFSVEEDGKRIAHVEFEGPRAGWNVDRVDPLVPGLTHLLGLDAIAPAPPPPPDPPAPLVAAASPPAPASATAAPLVIASPPLQSSTSRNPLGIAGLIAGAVGLAVAGGFAIAAVTSANERSRLCPPDAPCGVQAAYDAYHRAVVAQTGGWVSLALGGALLAAGAVFFFFF